METYKKYTGKKLDKVIENQYTVKDDKTIHAKIEQKTIDEKIAPYYPSEGLVESVEYARLLNRPLLLRGEPGSGKTKLAQAIAHELYGKDYRDYYFEWFIKSTSKAVDGLYIYDHLARLRDANFQPDKINDDNKYVYRNLGPLGKAFLKSTEDKPSVLLIDEIDKADIDFPNDLLLELDQKRFFIEETNEEIIATAAPIIIITSNDERELPNAFLRRCVFHYIDFPNEDLLFGILKGRASAFVKQFQKLGHSDVEMLDKAFMRDVVQRFRKLYSKMKDNPNARKPPSTSELLDWFKIIHYKIITGELEIKDNKLPDEMLYREVVLKSLDDQKIDLQ